MIRDPRIAWLFAALLLGIGREEDGNAPQGSAFGELKLNLSRRFDLFGNGGRFQAARFTSATASGGVFFRF
ncbi:MAG: hypothetical protein ACREQQ_05960 [Candidatus Binatia bacterium]